MFYPTNPNPSWIRAEKSPWFNICEKIDAFHCFLTLFMTTCIKLENQYIFANSQKLTIDFVGIFWNIAFTLRFRSSVKSTAVLKPSSLFFVQWVKFWQHLRIRSSLFPYILNKDFFAIYMQPITCHFFKHNAKNFSIVHSKLLKFVEILPCNKHLDL